jgi:hypothetical protein
MGFNKRYICTDSIESWYEHGGAKQVHDMYVKADVLILSGSIAQDIEEIIANTNGKHTRLRLIDDYFEQKMDKNKIN